MQHATNYLAKCVHPNIVFKLKQNIFCTCLAYTLLIWSRCPTVYSIPTVYN